LSPRDLDPVTLETPTIKGEVYTTGRGGSGNMTRNDDPDAARRAQDVDGYVCQPSSQVSMPPSCSIARVEFHWMDSTDISHSEPRRESTSTTHVGRGGAANVFKPSTEEIEKVKRNDEKWEDAIGDENSVKSGEKKSRGLADKGKDWILRRTSAVGKEITNGRETSSGDDDSLTLTQDEKNSKGLADKGKDWLWGLAK
jgi:hypothetical protein